jgi:hypothetical protein
MGLFEELLPHASVDTHTKRCTIAYKSELRGDHMGFIEKTQNEEDG